MCEERPLGPLLGHCAHLARERMDARLTEYDITPAQTHVLLYLVRQGGGAMQSAVTEHLRVKPSTANGILDRMEEKGLVCRCVHQTDARQKVVSLTEQGRARQAQFRAVFEETEALMARGLGEEERQQLRDLLLRVLSNLEEDRTL